MTNTTQIQDASTNPSPAPAFAPRTYRGGCACGAVRYEAEIDFSAGTSRCNCTMCAKASLWSVRVDPGKFTLLSGADQLLDFQRGGKFSHFPFCQRCGVRSFSHGDAPWMGGAYYSVHVNCLDVDEAELVGVLVRYFDGRHDNWQAPRLGRFAPPA